MSTKRSLTFVVCALAALRGAAAAEISGTVARSGKPASEVVVSIEGLRTEGPPQPAVHALDHRNLSFIPHVLVVRAGAAVRFENSDGMPCLIYSTSPAGNFVLRRREGTPALVTFEHAAAIEVRCAEHRRIHAHVLVKENPFFALTDAGGRYAIPNVPPGRYTVEGWYEGKVIWRKTVEVETSNLHLDFRFSRPEQPRDEAARSIPFLFLEAVK